MKLTKDNLPYFIVCLLMGLCAVLVVNVIGLAVLFWK